MKHLGNIDFWYSYNYAVSYYKNIDFTRLNEDDLLDFIENRQHAFSRNMLELIELNMRSAIRNNPAENKILSQITDLVKALHEKVEQLIRLHETRLFPFLRKLLEVYRQREPTRFLRFNLTESSVREIRAEHRTVLGLLDSLQMLTNQFETSKRADESLKLCYAELREFADDITQQLYRIDHYLLPRIVEIESKVLSRSLQEDARNYGHGGDA